MDEKDFVAKLGKTLIEQSCTGRIERAFACLGGNLREFLATLDGVHDVLQHQDEDADAATEQTEAGFVCTSNADNLQLDFTTEQRSVAYLLVGSLKALADKLYSTQVDIDVTQNKHDATKFRWVHKV